MQPRVLVIDDEQTILLSVSDYLTQKGYEVHCARTSSDAKAQLQLRPFAGAIVDLRLGSESNATGMELVRHLRKTAPLTKVIVLTAYGSAANQLEARQLGVSAFLSKPQPLSELAAILSRHVDGKPSAQPTRQTPKDVMLVDASVSAPIHQAQFSMAAGKECRVVPNIRAAMEQLSQNRYSLVLLEGQTASHQQEDDLSRFRAQRATLDVPLVLIASPDTPTETLETGFRAGVDDCVLMPVRLPEISARLAALTPGAPSAIRTLAGRGPKTLLLACGHPPWRDRLEELLESSGYHVLLCSHDEPEVRARLSGPEAIDLVLFCGESSAVAPIFSRPANRDPLGQLTLSVRGPEGGPVLGGNQLWMDNGPASPEAVVQKVNARMARTTSAIQVEGRVPFFCPVLFREVGKDADPWTSSYSYSVSPGGIFLRTLVPMRQGAALELRIHLTNIREVLEGTGVVSWANPYSPHRTVHYPIGMGVQFLGMSPKRLGQLREICRAAAGL